MNIRQVSKVFGQVKVLQDVDFTIEAGQFACLLGPSGCGKTTLLRCLAGLDMPDAGTIQIGEQIVYDAARGLRVPPNRRELGMVFQHYALWPHMNVRANISYPLRKRGILRGFQETRVFDMARLLGIEHLLDRAPGELSGGQQQRVALARALVSESKVLLLDEPLSNLDAALRMQLRREIRNMHDRLGMTTVLVTHDQEEAAALADVVAVMQNGAVAQYGPPSDILARPSTRYVAGFVGFDNFIESRAILSDGDGCLVRTDAGDDIKLSQSATFRAGSRVTVAAKSDSLEIADASDADISNSIGGTVLRVTRLGRNEEIEIEIGQGGLPIVVRRLVHETRRVANGDNVRVVIPLTSPLLPA